MGAAPSRFEKNSRQGFPGWVKVALSLVLVGQAMMVSLGLNTAETPPSLGSGIYWLLHGLLIASAVLTMALLGGPLWANFVGALRQRRVTVEALFFVTMLGALFVSLQSTLQGSGALYYEVVSVVLLIYTFGNSLKERATREARRILDEARASYARAWVELGGELVAVEVSSLKPGDCVAVRPGERVSVDGEVVAGRAFVQRASLTGEPTLVPVQPGDKIAAGAVSTDGFLKIRVDSTARGIDAIFEGLHGVGPSRYQQRADRVVGWFLPLVGGCAVLALGVGWAWLGGFAAGLTNAMSVLLIACPCALGIATPLAVQSFLSRLGGLGWRGRSGELVERLAEVDAVFFDKTGTLTLAEPVVADVHFDRPALLAAGLSEAELKGLVSLVERTSAHPLGRAFVVWPVAEGAQLVELRVHPGEGVAVQVTYRGETFALKIGRAEFAGGDRESFGAVAPGKSSDKRVWVYAQGRPIGSVMLAEKASAGVEALLETLFSGGLTVEVLTGDPHPQLRFDSRVKLLAALSPEQKAALVRAAQGQGRRVLFVGDGVNDALAMREASCSLAVEAGSALSHAVATAVVSSEGLSALPKALALAKKARAALEWNLQFAAVYNFAGIALALAGALHPVAASLLMLSSSVVVAWRALAAVGES